LGGRCSPGKFHIQWTEVVHDTQSQTPCVQAKYEVLGGTDPGCVGIVQVERLYFSPKSMKRVAIFATRLGLIDASAFGTRSSVDWSALVGQEAIVEIVEEEYTKKDNTKGISSKISFAGVWPLTDERVKDVPRGGAQPIRNGTAKTKKAPTVDLSDL
jgi:hypothetical protein